MMSYIIQIIRPRSIAALQILYAFDISFMFP